MALNIIGAGFGRTGTFSLKVALERLGYGPCYHMFEAFANPAHVPLWREAVDDRSGAWPSILHGYQATVDWPSTYFWQELAEMYPKAKIVLTVRDAEAWYASISQTIFASHAKPLPVDNPLRRDELLMAREILLRTFDGRIDDQAHVIRVYERHNQAVQRLVEANRLLVYEVTSGWPPLCQFLDRAIPDEAFPLANTRVAFEHRAQERTS